MNMNKNQTAKAAGFAALALAAVLLFTGCPDPNNDDTGGESPVIPAELHGTWTLGSSTYTFTGTTVSYTTTWESPTHDWTAVLWGEASTATASNSSAAYTAGYTGGYRLPCKVISAGSAASNSGTVPGSGVTMSYLFNATKDKFVTSSNSNDSNAYTKQE